MPLSKDEFDEACLAICPHCRAKATLKYRENTKEWTHDLSSKSNVGHSICWASGLRTSRFAEEAGA